MLERNVTPASHESLDIMLQALLCFIGLHPPKDVLVGAPFTDMYTGGKLVDVVCRRCDRESTQEYVPKEWNA